jgi:hypothetical protein
MRRKAPLARWRNGTRKEKFMVFARSFRREISGPDVELFDLVRLRRAIGFRGWPKADV